MAISCAPVLTASRPLRSGAHTSPPGGGQGAASDSPERVLKRALAVWLAARIVQVPVPAGERHAVLVQAVDGRMLGVAVGEPV